MVQMPQQRLAVSLRRDTDDLAEMDWTERVTDSQTDMVTSQPTASEQTPDDGIFVLPSPTTPATR